MPLPPLPTLRRAARLGCWALAVFVIAASLIPGEWRQHTPFPGALEHFMAYAALGFVLELGYGEQLPRGTFPILLVGVAAVLEIAQIVIPERHAAFTDFLASSSGALAGIGLAVLVARRAPVR